jgi:hypothetical protein
MIHPSREDVCELSHPTFPGFGVVVGPRIAPSPGAGNKLGEAPRAFHKLRSHPRIHVPGDLLRILLLFDTIVNSGNPQ